MSKTSIVYIEYISKAFMPVFSIITPFYFCAYLHVLNVLINKVQTYFEANYTPERNEQSAPQHVCTRYTNTF